MCNTIELKKFVLNLIDSYKDSQQLVNDELSTNSCYKDVTVLGIKTNYSDFIDKIERIFKVDNH